MARTIQGSVGKGGTNRISDIKVVQSLLNDNLEQLAPLRPLAEDGKVGPHTVFAIEEFQRRVVGLRSPDGRVDPGGKTLEALNEADVPVPVSPPVPELPHTYTLTFKHGGKKPPSSVVTGKTADLYESVVTLAGPKTGAFRGSIYPDDLSVRGRLKDGSYPIYLGFHKRSKEVTGDDGTKKKVLVTPTAGDLVARSDGFRAALIVNADAPVPVHSDKPGKTTSEAIHVHNGYRSKRFSDGCPTLHPDDWAAFIKLFLDAYPNLSDWMATSTYVGRKIGTLQVTV